MHTHTHILTRSLYFFLISKTKKKKRVNSQIEREYKREREACSEGEESAIEFAIKSMISWLYIKYWSEKKEREKRLILEKKKEREREKRKINDFSLRLKHISTK